MSSLLDVLPPAHHNYTTIKKGSSNVSTSLQSASYTSTSVTQPIKQSNNNSTTQLIQFNNRNAQLQPVIDTQTNQIDYSQLVKQRLRPDQLVHTSYSDTQEKLVNDTDIELPSDELVEQTRLKTAAALNQIVDLKTSNSSASNIKPHDQSVQYIQYTTNNSAGTTQRLIKLQQAHVDPLEPPKHKHMRLPVPNNDAPVPILHSPPRQLTAEDQSAWRIPPSISQWKNSKGYIIPLHQRIAADGKALSKVEINDRFSELSDELVQAERDARRDIESRAELLHKLAEYKHEKKEQELRELADRARQQLFDSSDDEKDENKVKVKSEPHSTTEHNNDNDRSNSDVELNHHQQYHDRVRRDTAAQVKRDMRLESRRADRHESLNQSNRDISEKIALGHTVSNKQSQPLFDSRLFNHAESTTGGFGADDSYNIYDKPLFTGSSNVLSYKPQQVDLDDEDGNVNITSGSATRYGSTKSFSGTDSTHISRSEPIQFEKGATDIIGESHVLNEDEQAKQSVKQYNQQHTITNNNYDSNADNSTKNNTITSSALPPPDHNADYSHANRQSDDDQSHHKSHTHTNHIHPSRMHYHQSRDRRDCHDDRRYDDSDRYDSRRDRQHNDRYDYRRYSNNRDDRRYDEYGDRTKRYKR